MRLFLCEKPSQAKDIAKILGANQRADGCIKGNGVTVTWGIGHLLETAPPESYGDEYKSWAMETLPILPTTWKVVVKPKTASQFKIVKQLLKEAQHLVIATDPDREGEMIARELVEFCGYRGPIERLWLSALNDASIRQALANIKSDAETRPLYYSALARSRADWLIGMNFTRLFTLLARQVGFGGVLSVGRVQTPTLWLVVQRDRAIAMFIPVPFWNVEVSLFANGLAFKAQWLPSCAVNDEGRCVDQREAIAVQQKLGAGQTAIAISVETERKREPPPLPFSLSALQETCSSKLGLGVQETLNIAQALYETHKATTYPRADNGFLPESMLADVPTVLAALRQSDPSLEPILQALNPAQRSRAWNDGQVTAHHGIIPTLDAPNLSAMSEKERAVYELIRTHYLAQFLPHHEFDRTAAQFDCQGLTLEAVGKSIVVQGWRSLITPNAHQENEEDGKARTQVLPPLQNASRCQVQGSELKALKTQAPKPFTEGDLVKAMKQVARYVTDPRLAQKLKETTGIGTEATRASIIQGLIDRGHLEKKGKSLRASESGVSLIDAVPAALADPGTTAIWEQALSMIEAGSLTVDIFIEKQSTWITKLVQQYKGTTLSIKVPQGPSCPLCQAKTIRRKGKTGDFWACSTYPTCKGSVNIGEQKKKTVRKASKPRPVST